MALVQDRQPFMNGTPLVSAIIPTYQRPELVQRAVRCALAQTLQDIEVIVVLDGPDEATTSALQSIHDPRLRVMALASNSGTSAARNRGVEAARAGWVAFLDDDDEWMPEKLEAQYWTATHSTLAFPIVSCLSTVRSRQGDLIWPRRLPAPGERIDEYLFCQNNLFGGEGLVLPTTILTRTELMRRVPFEAAWRRHQDIEWLLQAHQVEGCGVEFVPIRQPLAVWNQDASPLRISNTAEWRESLDWARKNRTRLSKRAIAGFLLTWTSLAAARQRQWKAFSQLPVEAFRLGRPRLMDLSAHLLIWLTPAALRTRISVFLKRLWNQHD